MELRESPLWQEIQSIAFNVDLLPPVYSWKAEIVLDNGNKTVLPFKVLSLEIFRDYRNAYGDELILEVMIAAGDFVYDVYPNRQNLLINLTKEGVSGATGEQSMAPDIEAQQLRATLMDDHSVTVEGLTNIAHSRQALNTVDILTVKFQLLDLALERIRMHSVGGVFRDAIPADVLKYILTSVSTGLDLDEDNAIKGVDMVESPNQETYKHIVIPHGTKFPEMPMFINHKIGGLYPTGMGVYLFRQYWYVYPLYDLTRFDSSTKTLTIINVPKNQLPGIERTYRKTANQIIVLATGDVRHADRTESNLLNQGNGVRYMDARKVIDGYANTDEGENKAKIMRAENNNEFVTDERTNGLNNVITSNNRITANKFGEMSKLAQRAGAELQVMWENSDMGAIYPGMPVKYLYIKDDAVVELTGIVLGAQHYVQTHGKGMTNSRHRTDTALHLFVSREKTEEASTNV